MQADASGQGPKRRAQGDSGDSRKRKQLRKPSAAEEEDSDESILSESEEIPSTLGDHDEIVPASDSGSSHSSNLVPDPHSRDGAEKLEGIAPFVSKCYNLVSDTRLHDIIRWSEAGDSFIIYNTQKFASDILPKSFKHNNFSSFVRQLNLYGFRRRVSNQVNVEFFHESFRRDAKHLLRRIGRQKPITAKQEMAKQQAAQDTVDVRITQLEERLNNQGQELRDVQDDMNTLRRANTVLKTEVSTWRGHCENLVSVMNFGYSIAQAQQQNASAAAAAVSGQQHPTGASAAPSAAAAEPAAGPASQHQQSGRLPLPPLSVLEPTAAGNGSHGGAGSKPADSNSNNGHDGPSPIEGVRVGGQRSAWSVVRGGQHRAAPSPLATGSHAAGSPLGNSLTLPPVTGTPSLGGAVPELRGPYSYGPFAAPAPPQAAQAKPTSASNFHNSAHAHRPAGQRESHSHHH